MAGPGEGRATAPRGGGARRTFGAAVWVAAYHGGQALVAIAVLVALARILDPHEFAVAAVAFSVVSLFTPVAEGFFNDVVLQRRSIGPRDLASAWVGSIALGAALALLMWVLARPVAWLVGLPEVAELLPWMGLTLAIGGVAAVPAAFARRRGRYRALALRLVPGRLAGAVVGVAAALLGFGAWSVAAQHLVATTAVTALLLAGSGLRLRPRLLDLDRLRALVRFSLASVTDNVVLPAYGRLATPLVSALLGAAAAAQWNLALRLVDMLYGLVYSAAAHLTVPLLARRQDDAAAVRAGFIACTGIGSLVVLPVFAGMALTAPELVSVLLGATWAPAAPLVSIFSVTAILLFLRQFALVAMTAVGRPGDATRVSVLGLAASLAGLVAGASVGLPAAAAASVLRALPFYVPGARLLRRATGIGIPDQFRPVVRPLLATGAMALAVVAARTMLLQAGLPPALVLLGCVAVGGVAYGLAAAALARQSLGVLLGGAGIGIPRRAGAGPR